MNAEHDHPDPSGADDPRVLRRLTPQPRASDTALTIGALVVAIAGAAAFVVAVIADAGVTMQAGALTAALLGLALGLRRGFASTADHVEAEQPRPARPDPVDMGAMSGAMGRRSLLGRLMGAAAGLVGLSVLAPLAGLGRPRQELTASPIWTEGVRLLDRAGQPVRVDGVPPEGIATLWPDGSPSTELATVILVRLPNGTAEPPTRTEWVVDGIVAYSKICTHAGCPVAMYDTDSGVLLCPCHQGQFDAVRGAEPVFGPVSRPLPQLPLGVNGDGELIALGDFSDEPGPSRG